MRLNRFDITFVLDLICKTYGGGLWRISPATSGTPAISETIECDGVRVTHDIFDFQQKLEKMLEDAKERGE